MTRKPKKQTPTSKRAPRKKAPFDPIPTFNTFDPDRFPKDFGIQLQAAMMKPTLDGHTYEDVEHLNAICELAIEEKRKGCPRAGQEATRANLTKEEIKLLYHHSQLSEAATETLTIFIKLQSIKLRAKWN